MLCLRQVKSVRNNVYGAGTSYRGMTVRLSAVKLALLLPALDGGRLSVWCTVARVFKDFASEKKCNVAGSFKMSSSQGSIEYIASDPRRADHELVLFSKLVLV